MRRFNWLIGLGFVLWFTTAVFAEEAVAPNTWDFNTDLSFNLTQSSYSDNWTGAEKGTISWSGLMLMNANKQLNSTLLWKNTLRLSYGQTHTQDAIKDTAGVVLEKKWLKPSKSTDEIDFESLMSINLKTFVDPFVAVRMQSKFSDDAGNTLNPLTITESAGIGREFFKKEEASFDARVGFAFRQLNDKRLEEIKLDATNDGGIEFVANYQRLMMAKKANFVSRLRLFQPVFYSESNALEVSEDWKTVDLDWQNTLTMSLTKYINLNLYLQLFYDKDHRIDDGIQIKETLGLGFTYKLF